MGVMTNAHTRNAYTHTDTGCASVGTWKQRWQCIYSIYYTVAYESSGVYIPNVCIYYIWRLKNAYAFMFSFFLSVSSVFLWSCCKTTRFNLLGSLSGQGFTSQHLLCLPDFFLYLFLCTRFLPLPVELSQTFVLAFDCTGLQRARPKSAFVHGGGASVCVHGCASVCLSIPGPCCLHDMACVPVILQQSLCSLPLQDVLLNPIFSVILLM